MKKSGTSTYAVSTVAFGKVGKEKLVALADKHGWAVEFSSGFPPDPEMIPFYKSLSSIRYPHNYFPAPADPFVMNLASGDDTIRNRTINHCLQGLELAKIGGAPFFSAHAGFCIDPNPEQLGRPLDIDQDFDRSEHLDIFLESVNIVLQKADELEIGFLIENNVLAPFNHRADRPVALFCVEGEEMVSLIEQVNHPRLGILLDTAHLKVSAHTLNFDKKVAAELVSPIVKVVHHSDNDGLADTNQALPDDYWAADLGEIFKGRLHVLEVKNLSEKQIEQQLHFLQNIYDIE